MAHEGTKVSFVLNKTSLSDKVYSLKLDPKAVEEYLESVQNISVKDIEYIPYFRFLLARDFACIFAVQDALMRILNDYQSGAVLIECGCVVTECCSIKIATAISYLLGIPQIDPLSGQHYALFTIEHIESQLPNLLRPYECFKLHTDGAYMEKAPDWVSFMKVHEESAIGGETRLLHVADWEDFNELYSAEGNKTGIFLPILEDKTQQHDIRQAPRQMFLHHYSREKRRKKSIRFIDRFIYPNNIKEAEYIYAFSGLRTIAKYY